MATTPPPKAPVAAGAFRELARAEYLRVLAPLEALPMNTLFARAVVERGAPGRVFAYPAESPRVVYVAHAYGMSLLCGTAGPDRTDGQLLAHLVDRPRADAEWLQVWPDAWAERLAALAPAAGAPAPPIERHTRVNFAFSPRAHRARRPAPAGYRLARADRSAFAMPGSVVPRAFWRDADHFLGEGAGFAVFIDGEPVSLAFSSFVNDSALELGIETRAPYRGRGLAALACAALIDDCVARGLEPVWACRLENTASYRLAEKLGFVPVRSLPYFRLPPRPLVQYYNGT